MVILAEMLMRQIDEFSSTLAWVQLQERFERPIEHFKLDANYLAPCITTRKNPPPMHSFRRQGVNLANFHTIGSRLCEKIASQKLTLEYSAWLNAH